MLAFAFTLLCAPAATDVDALLRHLQAVASAQSPAPSPDGARFAFVTTLFGSRQVASMAVEGSYPVQLTDEPGGVIAVRYSPTDAKTLVATALRDGQRRLVFLDEEGNPPRDVDAAAKGEQVIGGFTRDGKKLLYAVVDGGKATLALLAMDSRKSTPVTAPPPAAGIPAPPQTLEEALHGLTELSAPSPDGRAALAVVHRGDADALVLVDLSSARTEPLTKPEGKVRIRWPRFSPDGKSAYVMTDAARQTMGVDAIALQGAHARRPVYVPKTDLESYAVSEDGHRLAVAVEQQGETLFSLLDFPSLRAQPLPQPPAGALAESNAGEPTLVWSKQGDRLYFAWRLSDDTTDVWSFRMGYGTPQRHTRSPRPGIPRGALVRPQPVKGVSADGNELSGWLWKPADADKPRIAVLVSSREVRPVFDKRIAALNDAGLAVIAFNGAGAQAAALRYARENGLDATQPLLLDPDDLPVDEPAKWGGVVGTRKGGLQLDPHDPDLPALVKYARRPSTG